jgi:hypothetical protein
VRHNGVNNGEISFGCREAEKLLGWSYRKAARMFDILIERGFLVVVCNACFDLKTKKPGPGASQPNLAATNRQLRILCIGGQTEVTGEIKIHFTVTLVARTVTLTPSTQRNPLLQ